MVGKIINGVGFLLFSRSSSGAWEIFIVEELQSKPEYHKSCGMVSFPLETFEERDVNFWGTISRLIREEIGFPAEEIAISGIVPEYFQPIPGREDVHITYGYGLFTGDRNRVLVPEDKDVKFAGWCPIELLFWKHTRIEVRPILEHFIKNHLRALLEEYARAVS